MLSTVAQFIVFGTFVAACVFHGVTSQDFGHSKLFPYGMDHLDATLPRDKDDVASPELRLQVPIVFFGKQYSGVYINQNGLITFLTDIPAFVNMQFPLDYPTIAPLYSDVDTRISGAIYYRETQSEELLEKARTMFSDHFSSAVNFQPSSLLIVTWDDVGYFDRKSDKVFKELLPPEKLREPTRTNTYQLVIGSDGGDSYVVFLYDHIGWIQGTGKNPSMPDAKAQAGLISGTGPHFSLKGSGTDQVSSLHKRTNGDEEGVWMFRIGKIGDLVEQPDQNYEMESSSESTSSCSTGGETSCHSQAQCVDYNPGYCCQCTRGYFGNGRVCLQETDNHVRMNGKVKGVLNGMALEDSDLFSYILPQDGRAYTAVAKVPEQLGYDIQAAITLGTNIGWLFSTSLRDAPNGFTLTGGILNYTTEINFLQTGDKVQVHQSFTGLDVFNHLRVDTRIHGTLPVIPVGKTIDVTDLKMEFTRVSAGLIRSRSKHSYLVEGTSLENAFTVEQTIEYEECPWAAPVPPELNTVVMKVGRHYITYDPSQEIARYAITSKVTPVDGDDPCKENKDKCAPNSSCVVEDDTFRCICNLGYERQYFAEDGPDYADSDRFPVCFDIDECGQGQSTCDVTAICTNTPGSYYCECQPGYAGDGYTCTKVLSCEDVHCGPNAECIEVSEDSPECRCLPGFYGDGLYCYEPTGVEIDTGEQPDCRQVRNLCDIFAECVYSDSSESFICSCLDGYVGDGLTCHRDASKEELGCEIENRCHYYASCKFDESRGRYSCKCQPGYIGDGYTCLIDERIYGESDTPHQQPLDPICVFGSCSCPGNFAYDDLRGVCVPATLYNSDCSTDISLCHENAQCVMQEDGSYGCRCNDGFSGSGQECSPQDFCSSHSECSAHGECAYSEDEFRYSCRCREGFEGDGIQCRPKQDAGCDVLRNCDSNAHCSWDSLMAKFECQCNPGYVGNGLSCQEDVLGCNILQNCDRNADCTYDPNAQGYRCRCLEGYEGDGYRCRSSVPCYRDRSICDVNAECVPDGDDSSADWKCQCRKGFKGDGQTCTEVSTSEEGEMLVVAKGMSLIKINLASGKPLPLSVEPFQTAIGIDADCPSQMLYWSDVATRAIKYGNFNGTGKGTFLDHDIGSPEGLSIDSASGNLYWTDSLKDTIEVASIKTKIRKVLIDSGLVNPRGIVVYPQRGRLFWSDWNRDYPKIEYSGLDGNDRQTLVGEGLALPNSLVIDIIAEQLCWADAGTKKIECVNIDGGGRRTHVMNTEYPFGLALGPENFFWSDWQTTKVESARRRNGEIETSYDVSLGGPGKLYGLVYIPTRCPQVYSPCEYSPCGQERICLPNMRGGRSCLCGEQKSEQCQDLL